MDIYHVKLYAGCKYDCFSFWISADRYFCSEDPYEMLHHEVFHQGLHRLPTCMGNLFEWNGLMCVFFLIDFCLRIAEDFETSLDDWKPNPGDLPVMNACVVPAGTYEVCSRTINKQSAG